MSEILAVVRHDARRVRADAIGSRLPGAPPTKTFHHGAVTFAVAGSVDALTTATNGVALGGLADVQGPRLAGRGLAHAYIACHDDRLVAEVDLVASRTLWWIQTQELIAVSTSQRLIARVIGDFQPSDAATAWMFSAGNLGPGRSGWDRRVHALPPGGRLVVDLHLHRAEELVYSPVIITGQDISPDEFAACLESEIGNWVPPGKSWCLPLSGGVDSRALAVNLSGFPMLTWGGRRDVFRSGTDAAVATSVAAHLGAQHRFIALDAVQPNVAEILTEFVASGEGRVDHIGGYLDAMSLWSSLRDQGVAGVIRGDQTFGGPARQGDQISRGVELTPLVDIRIPDHIKSIARERLIQQDVPDELGQQVGESEAVWRDRLYQSFRLPVIIASLTSVKTPYLEVANPCLTDSVVAMTRRLPDELRTAKAAIKSYVSTAGPDLPFATTRSSTSASAWLRTDAVRRHLAAVLSDSNEPNSLEWVVAEQLATRPSRAAHVIDRTAARLSKRRAKTRATTVSTERLALRLVLTRQAHDLLRRDAGVPVREVG